MTGKRVLLPGILLMLAVLLVAADPVSAAEQTASGGGYLAGYENTEPQPTAISWWSTAAYLVSLFAIFAFVVGMAYFAARFLGGHFAQQRTGTGGQIIAHLPLGPNRSICVVLMAGKCFMLGVTEHNITLLTELDDPEVIAHLKRESEEHPLSGDMFAKQFGALGDLVQKIPPRFRK
jgi:flagellar protein FliO/FliZ